MFNNAQNTLLNPMGAISGTLANDEDRQSAQSTMLGQLAMLALAAGQRQTAGQRAATIASAAPVIGGYQRDVLNAAQARLMQAKATQDSQELERQNAIAEKLQDPAFAQGIGLTPEQAALLGPQGAIDALKARATHDPMDALYKAAMIKKLQQGDAAQWQKIGQHFDEQTGQMVDDYGYPPAPGQSPTGSPMQLPGGGNTAPNTGVAPQKPQSIFDKIGDKRGQEALAIIKKEMPMLAPTVEGMAMGDIPYSPSLIKTPRGEMIDSLVRMVDPSYSPTTYDARKKALLEQQSNTPNSAGGIRKLADTALRHFKALYESSDALPNSELGPLSSMKNQADLALLRKTGNIQDPNMKKLGVFDNTLEIGGDEMAKALGIAAEGGREAIKHMFDPSQGRGVVREKIRNQIRLLEEKLRVQDEAWKNTMGPAANRLQVISPQMEEAFRLGAQKPMSEQQITKAHEAIQKGANRDEVIKHIIDSGYDPAGL